ncbi:xylose isomerase [Polaromonas sp. JS666]|uniref:xylose isomerase n=1 Tax=Polaromonas sp. (strain JS666 / ATCC BAA-500) TaxID=296591 RepID=UPI0008846560|nr:xylose isomerase [Polaromonas sp. JS666]SDO08516.1 D-xylose isomerase [Polaromonas sp. JS666]
MTSFESLPQVRYEGPQSTNPLAYRHYDAKERVLGKTMEQHLRLAVCYWHTFVWPGNDVFGQATFARPWHVPGDELTLARRKADAAFGLISRLGVPFYTFHDTDVAPEGASLADYRSNLSAMVDVLAQKQQETGIALLWGTANLFSHPRYAAGAASNPDPEVFAYAATQVFSALNATHRLGGANYVMWGGREGYDTLLNTDLRRERRQLGRFMQMVVEHKHKIGFAGQLLIEPKPLEPTKHQYDYDSATVYGFLKDFGLEREIKLNIEANHATLAGHSFQHEIATAAALGIFGSIDANRGDPQNGWDTDQFPNSVEDLTLAMYEILRAGGVGSGGFNFDAKVRRQSMDPVDILHGHAGAIDALALALKSAARLVEAGELERFRAERYARWDGDLGRGILGGDMKLSEVAEYAFVQDLRPRPVSGRQEWLENRVNAAIFD